jgi:tRNA(Ser,Leu) C12 N-acetylase TAN1
MSLLFLETNIKSPMKQAWVKIKNKIKLIGIIKVNQNNKSKKKTHNISNIS